MRVDVGNSVRVKPGDLVRIRVRLPKKATYARLGVWSATEGYELSPHVQSDAMGVLEKGRPLMLKPMYTTLGEHAPSRVIGFIADDELVVRIRQEKDTADEPSALVKVQRIGPRRQSINEFFRRIKSGVNSLLARTGQ